MKEARRLVSEYQFRLGTLGPLISIRLYEVIGHEGVRFEQGHFIHIPTQAGPYMTSKQWNDNEARALNQVVSGFTRHSEDAVKGGQEPKDSWLVPTEDFK